MAYIILGKKSSASSVRIVSAIKSHFRCSSEQAMFTYRELESSYGKEMDNSLEYILDEFYDLEHVPTQAELYWQKVHEPYTESEKESALEWLETLSEEQKRHIEVLKYVAPVFTGPFA
jgi:hypothetical protein